MSFYPIPPYATTNLSVIIIGNKWIIIDTIPQEMSSYFDIMHSLALQFRFGRGRRINWMVKIFISYSFRRSTMYNQLSL